MKQRIEHNVKRFNKLVRSRFFLAALCIVLEFTQLVAVYALLCRFFLPMTIAGWVFYICILLYIINRDDIPELKMPWLILLCLLPIIGAFIFMLLSSNNPSKKEYLRYGKSHDEVIPYLEQNIEAGMLKAFDENAYSQSHYLYSVAHMPCYAHTHTTYYSTGEDFHSALLADLESAEDFVFMEYFIVQEGIMWNSIHSILRRKAGEGVTVCFMYDDFGCMTTLSERYYEQLEQEGIHCIPANKFTPVLSHLHNNRDHRKITVIDGKVGYTGGINLADEYINKTEKYGHWKDSAVRLEGDAVKSLTSLFLENWNAQADIHLDSKKYTTVSVSEQISPEDAALKRRARLAAEVMKIFSPLL